MTHANGEATVKTTDDLTLALQAAEKRIQEVQNASHRTLIDEICVPDWENWDASDEKALVTDDQDFDMQDDLGSSHDKIAA